MNEAPKSEPARVWIVGMFAIDQHVVTTTDAGSEDWREGSRKNCRWGVHGVIRDASTGHGWCYLVEHDDGSKQWYEHAELREPGTEPPGDDVREGVTTSVVPDVVAGGEEQTCVVCLKGGELHACIECGDRMHHDCSAMWGIGIGYLCWICREPWKKKERIRSRREEIARLQREIDEEGQEEQKMEPYEHIEYAGETYRVSITITGKISMDRKTWRSIARFIEQDGKLVTKDSNWTERFSSEFVPWVQERYDLADGRSPFVVDQPPNHAGCLYGRILFTFWGPNTEDDARERGVLVGSGVHLDYEAWNDVGVVGVLHQDEHGSRVEDTTLVFHLRSKVLKAAIKLAADNRVFSEPQESFGGFR